MLNPCISFFILIMQKNKIEEEDSISEDSAEDSDGSSDSEKSDSEIEEEGLQQEETPSNSAQVYLILEVSKICRIH